MISIVKLPIPDGEVLILTATIGGATTNTKRADWCDVYTDTFPEGITVTLSLNEFFAVWSTCMNMDLDDLDVSDFTLQ